MSQLKRRLIQTSISFLWGDPTVKPGAQLVTLGPFFGALFRMSSRRVSSVSACAVLVHAHPHYAEGFQRVSCHHVSGTLPHVSAWFNMRSIAEKMSMQTRSL